MPTAAGMNPGRMCFSLIKSHTKYIPFLTGYDNVSSKQHKSVVIVKVREQTEPAVFILLW